MYHYVYKIEHIETGEFYYGSRSSKCHPTLDDYMGSMTRWQPDKNKLKKIILKDDFETRDQAFDYEGELIKDYIHYNLNRNYALPMYNYLSIAGDKHPSKRPEVRKKLSEAHKGKRFSEEHKRKISEVAKQRVGELNPFYGKTHNTETREKIGSVMKEAMKEKIWIKNEETGECKRINKDEPIPEGWQQGRINQWNSKNKKGNNYTKGRKWIYNPNTMERKMIKPNENLPNGFIYGVPK